MEDLIIISNAFVESFTSCKEDEVSANIERAKEFYEKEEQSRRRLIMAYPKEKEYWQAALDRTKKILQSGFRSVTWEEYCKLQREKWLSKEPKEITREEYDEALNVLPPKCWIQNERYSMFFIGECTTMTFYGQYIYDKVSGKYYTALTDICDKSTWLDKMLNLS